MFKFNEIGELIQTPVNYTMEDLKVAYDQLIKDRQYISASRINHLIQVLNND